MSKHDILKAEWKLLGKPQMEYLQPNTEDWDKVANLEPGWYEDYDYRFAGDPHWELRQKWLDSDKKLLIECRNQDAGTGWFSASYPNWGVGLEYREAHTDEPETEVHEHIIPHPLYAAFDAAVLQATSGKGVRHGGDSEPFYDQPWYSIAKQSGVGGLVFQAMKKIGEASGKPDQESFERELLGGLVYGAMAYLYVQKHGFEKK